MVAPPIRSPSPPLGIFLSLSHPLPHETTGGHTETLQRPKKGPHNRSRRRDNLLRRILRDFGPRGNPKNTRSDQVRAPCFFPATLPATLPFHSKRCFVLIAPFHILRLLPDVAVETRGLT